MTTTSNSPLNNSNQELQNDVISDEKIEQAIEEIASDLDFIQMATIIQKVSEEES